MTQSFGDRRRIETILREPLTRLRHYLNQRLEAARNAENPQPFTFDDLRHFVSAIPRSAPYHAEQASNMLQAVLTGVAPVRPRFDTPETQLLWGAGLAFLKLHPEIMQTWPTPPKDDAPLSKTPLWQQIIKTRLAYKERHANAEHVREALRDRNTKYGWSEPGTGFTYNRSKNVITVDLVQSMIVGFEHARADVYHEIGKALLTLTYPQRMVDLYQSMQPLLHKMHASQQKKGPKLKPEEYKELRMLGAEWELRHMLFDAAEGNTANRFVANLGRHMLQDYSVSLNNTAVTFKLTKLTKLSEIEGASKEYVRYVNLCNAIELSFFANNKLFTDRDDGWRSVGVNPDMVRKTQTLQDRPENEKDDHEGISHPDFVHLRNLCGGPEGLENLQPQLHERIYGWKSRIVRADLARKKVIEEIWRLYAEDLVQKILQHTNEEVDKQLEQQQENGEDQDQDGEENDQDQQQSGGKGKGKKGKKQKGQPGDDGDDADTDDAGEDQEAPDQKGKKDKKKNDGKQKSKQKDRDSGEKDGNEEGEAGDRDEDGEDADAEDGAKDDADGKPGKNKERDLGADNDSEVPVEGAGEMPGVQEPNEEPADEVDPGMGNGPNQDAEADDGAEDGDDDAMTVSEIEDALRSAEVEEGADADSAEEDGAGEEMDGAAADGEGKNRQNGRGQSGKKAGRGKGRSLGDLSAENWEEYEKRVAELAEYIAKAEKMLRELQQRQVQVKRTLSKKMDILPQNGELKKRFDIDAHRNMVIKKKTGTLDKKDMERFRVDQKEFTPTQIDVFIWIDGSISMSPHNVSPKPLDMALQAAAIMIEASRAQGLNINLYVGMWGQNDPPIIITPQSTRKQIGQAMQAARKGLHSGTNLAPVASTFAKTKIEELDKGALLAGLTHNIIISDGDNGDPIPSKKNIEAIFRHTDRVTFDAVIISIDKQTKMAQMAKTVRGAKHHQKINTVVGQDPNTLALLVLGTLLQKIRECGSFTAEPTSKKRQQLRQALNNMKVA